MMNILNNFAEIFYPSLCAVCTNKLSDNEEHICLSCLLNLPKTNHLQFKENELTRLFSGKFPFQDIASFTYFSKGGDIQKIIHEIKYGKNKKLGFYIGILAGAELVESSFIKDIDYLVPVPLHLSRLKQRGFNQSRVIAEGISKKTNIPILDTVLFRAINNVTQTSKNKTERLQNTSDIFDIKDSEAFENKHILLIDDIITTGATIEVCAKKILTSNNAKVSIYSIGYTV